MEGGDRLAKDVVIVGARSKPLGRCACRDHQGNKVFFARMAGAGAGRAGPMRQRLLAALGLFKACIQPIIKSLGLARALGREHLAQIVIAHAASDDQNPLFAKGRQRLAHGHVAGRIEVAQQGQLQDRNVRFRRHHHQGNEDPVIPAAVFVAPGLKSSLGQQVFDPQGQVRRAGGVIGQAVGVLRKAIIVEQKLRARLDIQGGDLGLPMAGDHQDRLGPLRKAGDYAAQIGLHPVPKVRMRGRRVHEEARASAMGDEKARKDGHGAEPFFVFGENHIGKAIFKKTGIVSIMII